MSEQARLPRRHGPAASLARVSELSFQTFRQLARMKVFYFLIFFGILVIGSSMFVLRWNLPAQELKLLKDFSLAGMTLFSSLLAIVGTAMLLPKDIEDRTLYTILSKPVPRVEYLLGKLFGVLLLIGVSLLLMDLLFTGVLYLRQSLILAQQRELFGDLGANAEAAEAWEMTKRAIEQNGLVWELQYAIAAIFVKASVIAALSLLVSTFASSSLFTMVTAAVAFFAGHLQADIRAYYESIPEWSSVVKWVSGPLALVLPDFQLFNIVDAVVAGEPIAASVPLQLLGFGAGYVAVYLLLAWYVFQDKEI